MYAKVTHCRPHIRHGYETGPWERHSNATCRRPQNLHKISHSSLRLICERDIFFVRLAANAQRCNKGSIKFLLRNQLSAAHASIRIVAFILRTSINARKSAGVRRKMHTHGCRVIFVSLWRSNEIMAMD